MSYGVASALQKAVHDHLTAAVPGLALHDAQPLQPGGTYALLGAEAVLDASDGSGSGAEHRLVISVISDAAGFLQAKEIAVAISDALNDAPLALARGRLVGLHFLRAEARRRAGGAIRRVDLRFVARVQD